MALRLNLRQLERRVLRLEGELTSADLDWDTRDDMIRVSQPLRYELRAERLDKGILVQGRLRLVLDCECVRCLRPFAHEVVLENWSCLIAMDGEDKAPVQDDCVDLTPYIRDDIFLAFPQHPLCSPQCDGLANLPKGKALGGGASPSGSPVWEPLNQLKL
ncbi:MAG: DUF177 domain-containing protein [Verrucomicrobia bacterium]|nr:DUF177 domain-containing protein [Verrucomicrobiota bacterium]